MKLYNPFKPHIVEYEGKYYVRKYTIIGWMYRENNLKFIRTSNDPWWITFEYATRWCAADTLEDAIKIRELKEPTPNKMKVIYG